MNISHKTPLPYQMIPHFEIHVGIKEVRFYFKSLREDVYTKLCWLPLWWEAENYIHNMFPFATVTSLCFKNVHLIIFISSKPFWFPLHDVPNFLPQCWSSVRLLCCFADLYILLQKESPSTSRQSPANGHSSLNSSILVRIPGNLK